MRRAMFAATAALVAAGAVWLAGASPAPTADRTQTRSNVVLIGSSATSPTCTSGFCIRGDVTNVFPLYRGVNSVPLHLSIFNPQPFPISVNSISVTPSAVATVADCVASDIVVGNTSGTPLAVNPESTSTATIDVTIGLSTSTPSDCQSQSWPLAYGGSATAFTGPVASRTVLASSLDPAKPSQSVTYTATVTGVGGTPSGFVTFTDNATTVASCATVNLSGGAATCTVSYPSTGNHSIVATYLGDTTYGGSSSPGLGETISTCAPGTTGCSLSGANLSYANLANANLTNDNLNGATLVGTNLSGANLTGANLVGDNLSGANLARANLKNANLNSANLTGADLTGATTTGANFAKVTWSNTICVDGTNSNSHGNTCVGHL